MEYETNIPIESVNPTADPAPELRSLYDGDISSSILQKLSGYYLEHSDKLNPEDYFIVRTGNNDYSLYFGDISESGVITSATRVRYYAVNTGSYAAVYRLSVSELDTGSVDLDGYEAYIYSSYDSYLPSPYLAENESSVRGGLFTAVIMVMAAICVVGVVIGRFFNGNKK